MAKQETKNIVDLDVPKHVLSVAETLHNAGFDAYIIGGCVRGMIMKYPVADWEVVGSNPTGRAEHKKQYTKA